MIKFFLVIISSAIFFNANAQTILDTSSAGSSVIIQDARIEILGEKLQDHNAAITKANVSTSSEMGKKTVFIYLF